jgi:hypothetical protein
MRSGKGIRDLRQSVRFVRRDWGIDLLWNVMIVVVSHTRPLGRPDYPPAGFCDILDWAISHDLKG